MSRKLKISLIVVAAIMVLAAGIAGAITVVERNHEKIEQITIDEMDLSLVEDGTYTGVYDAFPVAVEVAVTVRNHGIEAIDLVKHTNGRGGAADIIPQHVVEAQSLLVDSISGATYSSKVILLAIQNAIQSAAGE